MQGFQLTSVIVAGGSGSRMGASLPKQFIPLAGIPILIHTISRFLSFDPGLRLAVVLPQDHLDTWNSLKYRWFTPEDQARIFTCSGDETRCGSVYKGLELLKSELVHTENCLVAIQDGVRPFVGKDILSATFEQAARTGNAISAVPVKSSLRIQSGMGSLAVDRSQYWEVQTPQTFNFNAIWQAYLARPNDLFTDDAGLYEQAGNTISLTLGSYDNIKITTPEDLELAGQIYSRLQKLPLQLPQRDQIKLILLDVDGTLTDGGVYYAESGEEMKKFNVKDGLAIHRMISRYNMTFGLISSGTTPHILARRAEKLGIQRTYSGPEPKIHIVSQWLEELGLDFSAVVYAGDDLNDLAVIRKAGFSACPADAADQVKKAVNKVLHTSGGQGCIRELLEEVLGFDL